MGRKLHHTMWILAIGVALATNLVTWGVWIIFQKMEASLGAHEAYTLGAVLILLALFLLVLAEIKLRELRKEANGQPDESGYVP